METFRAFNNSLLAKLPQTLQELFKSLPLNQYNALIALFVIIFTVCLISVILGDNTKAKKVVVEEFEYDEPVKEQEEPKKKVAVKAPVQKKVKKEAPKKKKVETKEPEVKEEKKTQVQSESVAEDWVVVESKRSKKKVE